LCRDGQAHAAVILVFLQSVEDPEPLRVSLPTAEVGHLLLAKHHVLGVDELFERCGDRRLSEVTERRVANVVSYTCGIGGIEDVAEGLL